MWTLNKRWWLILPPLLAPGVITLIIGSYNPAMRTSDDMSFRSFGILWIALMLLIQAGMFAYLRYQKTRARYFAQKGIPAAATILSTDTTGTEVNNMPEIELCLEIHIPGREPYTIRHTSCWNPLSLAGLQPGRRLRVLVDPRNDKKIMFEDEAAADN